MTNTPPNNDPRQIAPAAARNRNPILDVLQRVLPPQARVLEIASGSGEHAVYFANALPEIDWQPSDPNPQARDSIAAWTKAEGVMNVRPPRALDASEETWPVVGPFDAVISINMIHIAPWEATLGLFAGASHLLPTGGALILYGPFMRDGRHTAPSNASFDESLRSRDRSWGVRDLDDVAAVGASHDLNLADVFEMPANNLIAVFKRA